MVSWPLDAPRFMKANMLSAAFVGFLSSCAGASLRAFFSSLLSAEDPAINGRSTTEEKLVSFTV